MTDAAVAPIRVLVVDDQAMVRGSFAAFLDAQPGIRVVGQASDGAEALRTVAATVVDVVLMDVRMPEMDGLEAARRILAGAGHVPRIVMVTTFDVDEYVHEALRAGASGFLLKDASSEELARAVRIVAAGDALLAPSVTRRMLDRFAEPRAASSVDARRAIAALTQREREVLVAIAEGLSNREIAASLLIGEQTVKTYVGRLLQKVPARDRVQLVIAAYDAGIVRPG